MLAEGIETEAQLERLRQVGCDSGRVFSGRRASPKRRFPPCSHALATSGRSSRLLELEATFGRRFGGAVVDRRVGGLVVAGLSGRRRERAVFLFVLLQLSDNPLYLRVGVGGRRTVSLGVHRRTELAQEPISAPLRLRVFDLRLPRLAGLFRLLGQLLGLLLHLVHQRHNSPAFFLDSTE